MSMELNPTLTQAAPVALPKARKDSVWNLIPSWRESLPGALAMIIIAIFCGLPGIPWPFTIQNLLSYIDQILPPIYGKGLFVDLLHFNYVVIGLVVGMVIRNVIGVPKSWEPGLSFTPVLMNAGIIMLGSQYMLRDLIKIGGRSVALISLMVFACAAIVIIIGRMFKMKDSLVALISAGFSMCGVSAVVAIAPMVRAKSEEVAYAIAALITFGVACLFLLPFVGRLLELSQYTFGIFSAAGVPNSAQVIATGFNFGFEAGKVAGFANIGRIVLIPAGVLFIYFATLSKDIRSEKISYWEVIKEKFPFFVFGFVAVWVANILHFFPKPAVYAMETVMVWFFTLCFVGIGLQTKFADVKQAGVGGVIMGWVAGLLKVGITLAIVLILMKFGIF
jgi:uncharacterized integral membrane protein (TIGR00698 family)